MNQSASHSSHDPVFVSLVSSSEGADSVAIELTDGEVLMLSPEQARHLATNLITAVNRAEVKASLRVSTNLWRRESESEKRLATVAG